MVDINKPYKPVFICYFDFLFAVTLIVISFIYYWLKLNISMKTSDCWQFLPVWILFCIVIFILKFIFGVAYLSFTESNKNINKSIYTTRLFWYRIIYNYLAVGIAIFSIQNVIKENSNAYKVKFTIISILLIYEIAIY